MINKLIAQQIEHLFYQDQWDDKAIVSYERFVTNQLEAMLPEEQLGELQKIYTEASVIGSDIYVKMFAASETDSREKLNRLIQGHMGGVMDENHMLQLTGPMEFDKKMGPYHPFWHLVATAVQESFEEFQLNSPMIHQFRMYIDRHNLEYVRNNYKVEGQRDAEALSSYVKAELGDEKLIDEGARYHNKYLLEIGFKEYTDFIWHKDGLKENRKKLTPDFHSEFIIDSKGNFVSQWNVLDCSASGMVISDYQHYRNKYQDSAHWLWMEQQLMNTESFNYANRVDDAHLRLDSRPPRLLDHDLRKSVQMGVDIKALDVGEQNAWVLENNRWGSPSKQEFYGVSSSWWQRAWHKLSRKKDDVF